MDHPLPQAHPSVQGDINNSPESERETAAMQDAPRESATLDDPEVDASQVRSLPGVGGIDDAGDVEVNPDDLHMPRRSAPIEPRG